MKHGVLAQMMLVLSVAIWPPVRTLASIDLSCDAAAGMITNAHSTTGRLYQLAKHDGEDNDEGDEQGEHGDHHRQGRHHKSEQQTYENRYFCGPYFKSSSVPYFRNYYSRDNYANLPPGLRKHVLKTGHLPPGLEKKYERTGELPPGLQKRFGCGETLPADYSPYLYSVPAVGAEKIGPLPPDSKLYLLGDDLILLNDHTKAIIDILRGAY
jgi:hypothetical protein